MNLTHIAKIALFTGMTYWLGNIVVLGGAAACAPQALTTVDHLPAWLNRLAGFAGIVGVYQRHDYAVEKHDALARWADYVDGLASGRKAKVVTLRG